MVARNAVQIYALKDSWAADQPATLARIAGFGIEGVEAFGLGETTLPRADRLRLATEFRKQIADVGLTLTGAHTQLPTADDADWVFETMTELGAPIAIASTTERVLGFTRDALADPDRLPRFADRLNALATIGASHGVRIGYHNHWWEWAAVNGRPAYDQLVERLSPEIALEIDLFWAYSAGQDVAELVARYADRVEFVHVKDGNGVQGAPQVNPGSGEVPLAAALKAATSLRWQVLELDVVAPDVDVWDVVAAGASWLAALPA